MDQDQDIQDLIKQRLHELPAEVQKAITDENLPKKFDEISKKFSLRIDQSGSLQLETLLLMLGLEDSEDFVDNLMKEAEMSREMAVAVTEEVNTHVLNEIRQTLRQMEEIAEAQEAEERAKTEAVKTVTAPEVTGMAFTKDETLKGIEDPSIHSSVPINLMPSLPLVIPTPQKQTTEAPSFVNTILTTPTISPTVVVEKKPVMDPYREPIE